MLLVSSTAAAAPWQRSRATPQQSVCVACVLLPLVLRSSRLLTAAVGTPSVLSLSIPSCRRCSAAAAYAPSRPHDFIGKLYLSLCLLRSQNKKNNLTLLADIQNKRERGRFSCPKLSLLRPGEDSTHPSACAFRINISHRALKSVYRCNATVN